MYFPFLFFGTLFLILVVLSGPIALILSIILYRKINSMDASAKPIQKTVAKPIVPKPVNKPEEPSFTEITEKDLIKPKPQPEPIIPVPVAEPITHRPKRTQAQIEQQIGTRWVLIAGVVALFVGVAFFLKYAYDNFSFGPLGRVIMVTVSGIIALIVGEITRRKNYGIVAKGVTALGFAVLYTAVFSAYKFYLLIETTPAFVLSILITAAAIIYAVGLDEILIAFLSLLGGFATPVIFSTGENMPMALFTYVLILGIGAMACAYLRSWPAVNFLTFAGTVVLYTGWFEKFVRPDLPTQMTMAISWLCVFFAVYLVLPIMYGLVNRVKARQQDAWLLLVNAIFVFYYLWIILSDYNRDYLALAAVDLFLVYLFMMLVVQKRCSSDTDLKTVLLTISLFFLIVAVPLYFKADAIVMIWAVQGVILSIIGLRYKSIYTQLAAGIALLLSCNKLLALLPLHEEAFKLILNPDFGIWCLVVAAMYICHLIYRHVSKNHKDPFGIISQFFYAAGVIILMSASTMEWYFHCKYNLMTGTGIHYISRGQLIIFGVIILLFAIRPLCPAGLLCEILSLFIVSAGAIFTIVALTDLHNTAFVIFANPDFVIVFAFIAAMLTCHLKYRLISTESQDQNSLISQVIYAMLGALLLAAIAVEWHWHCKYNLSAAANSPIFLKGMVMIFTAIMLLFVIRPICPDGPIATILASIIAVIGSIFTMIVFTEFYRDKFIIFANVNFAIAILFVIGLFAAACFLLRSDNHLFSAFFAVMGVFVLWVLLSEQIYLYWYCLNKYGEKIANWKFLAQMYISISWAVYGIILMAIGFWRKIKSLRYIALGLFALLLLKVFILDTSTVKNLYRIAAFLATGITLVGVSYLYQCLKKKGFFALLEQE